MDQQSRDALSHFNRARQVASETLQLMQQPNGTIPTKPVHEHDCSRCIYLGSVAIGKDGNGVMQWTDLYFCVQFPDDPNPLPTVIARYGKDGNYWSGISIAASMIHENRYTDHPLAEALRRAILKGLFVPRAGLFGDL